MTDVRLTPEMVKENERMLTGAFMRKSPWAMTLRLRKKKAVALFGVDALRAIQLSKREVLDVLAKGQEQFSTAEWRDLLLRSVGFEPETLPDRAKDALLLRMVPLLSATTTWLSWAQEALVSRTFSAGVAGYAHLISGGKATVARMFVNNANGQRGLVLPIRRGVF